MPWIKLHTDLIDDAKASQLSDKNFRIFINLLLFTKESNQNGTISVSLSRVAWRLRCTQKNLKNAITELTNLKIISFENNVLTFINWRKRQYSESFERVRKFRYRNVTVTAHETEKKRGTTDYRLQTTDLKDFKDLKDLKKRRGSGTFVPPTPAEVSEYCTERGNGVDASRWFDYYTSNGWRVGKNPMKNWRAAVRTWERDCERANSNPEGARLLKEALERSGHSI